MNVSRLSRRLSVAGVATALAAAGLVGAGSTAAQAATVTNTYTCTNTAMMLSKDIPVQVTGELPVPQYWAGAGVPAGLVGTVTVDATIPDDTAPLLVGAGVDGARSDDFGFALGSGTVPAPIAGAISADGKTWHATGSNTAFTTPVPGQYDALLPSAFSLQLQQGASDSIKLDCALLADTQAAPIGSIDLLKQSSTTTVVPTVIKVKKGKAALVPMSAESASIGGPVSGKVVAKEGSKKLDSVTLKKGKATLNLGKKLKVGKHKIAVSYLGTPSVGGSSDKVVVKVVK